MSEPPLATFLDEREPDTRGETIDPDAFATLESELVAVLAETVSAKGVAAMVAETSLDPGALEPLSESPALESPPSLTLGTAAAILSTTTPFPESAVRARLRDHLIVAMSRGPSDVATVSERYGFDEPASLRAKIEGEEPFPLGEYARLRVVLGWLEGNHNV